MENSSSTFQVEALIKLSTALTNRSTGLTVLEVSIVILMNITSVIGNVLVCIAVYRNHRLHSVTNVFVVALAVSDLAMGCFSMPITSGILIQGRFPYGNTICMLHGFCILTFAVASLETLCAIAINRYFCIVRPQQYTSVFTKKKTSCYLAIVLCIAMMCAIPPSFSIKIHYTFQPGKAMCLYPFESSLAYTLFLEIICINTPLAIIAMCYLRVYRVVRNVNQAFIKNNTGPNNQPSTQLAANVEEAKVTKTLVAVLIGFVSCWLPICVVDIIDVVMGTPVLPRQLYLCYALLAYTSSTINPFIYGVFNRTFRREYRNISSCNLVTIHPSSLGHAT